MSDVDWTAIAQEVAIALKGEPNSRSPKEWRWGNRGSFCLDVEAGTFFDFEDQTGGNVVTLVMHCEGLDKPQAIQWLRDHHFLPERRDYNSQPRPATPKTNTRRRKPKVDSKPHDSGKLQDGLDLWHSAALIPTDKNHPAHRWQSLKIGDKHPFPDAFRYHANRRYVLACIATLPSWIASFPHTPAPQAVHLIAITDSGKPRNAWKGSNKQTWGRVDGCGIFVLGNPSDRRINLCEGVADALAIHRRVEGAVFASITTLGKLVNYHSVIQHIALRSPVIFPDMDEAGIKSARKLENRLLRAGANSVTIRSASPGSDPADSARKERQ